MSLKLCLSHEGNYELRDFENRALWRIFGSVATRIFGTVENILI
jgi:hypothetical protein